MILMVPVPNVLYHITNFSSSQSPSSQISYMVFILGIDKCVTPDNFHFTSQDRDVPKIANNNYTSLLHFQSHIQQASHEKEKMTYTGA